MPAAEEKGADGNRREGSGVPRSSSRTGRPFPEYATNAHDAVVMKATRHAAEVKSPQHIPLSGDRIVPFILHVELGRLLNPTTLQ